ncbi:MAG: creatininase family protein, partial [Armatimonadota bacterium]
MIPLTLENTSWDFKASAPEIALMPLAAHEPHGAHLPVGTDGLIISAIARGVAQRLRAPTYLLPVWPLGASGSHMGQPGAVSLEH